MMAPRSMESISGARWVRVRRCVKLALPVSRCRATSPLPWPVHAHHDDALFDSTDRSHVQRRNAPLPTAGQMRSRTGW